MFSMLLTFTLLAQRDLNSAALMWE